MLVGDYMEMASVVLVCELFCRMCLFVFFSVLRHQMHQHACV